MIITVLMPDADSLGAGPAGMFYQIIKDLFFLTGKLPNDFFKYVMAVFFNEHPPLLFGFFGRLEISRLMTSETNGMFKVDFF